MNPSSTPASQPASDPASLAMVLLAAIFLGLAVALARLAFEGGANGITVALMRASVGAVCLYLFCRATGRRMLLARGDFLHVAGKGVLGVVMYYGNIGAVEYITIGLAALLFFTYLPLVALLGWASGREVLTPLKSLAVLGSFAGLALMLGVSFSQVDLRGVALALAAALGVAINALWLVNRLRHVDGAVIGFHMCWIAGLILWLAVPAAGLLDWPELPIGWFGLFAVVGLQVVGVPTYFVGMQRIGALNSAMLGNVQPMTAIAVAYFLFGELLSPVQLLGGALVLGGIWLMQWTERRRLARVPPPKAVR